VCGLSAALALLALSAPALGAVRAAFYEPISAESWLQVSPPYSHYTPVLGPYDSALATTVQQQVAWMEYANMDAGIAYWDGQGSPTDSRIGGILGASAGSSVKWALDYRGEQLTDPSVLETQNDLEYINARYASQSSYLRIGGSPVLFVRGGAGDTCDMADRWQAANTLGFYIVLTVVPGYTSCAAQPNSWYAFAPDTAESHTPGYSYSISPGAWSSDAELPQLARLPWPRWKRSIERMVASNEPLQLVTTWNDWAGGSAVEPAVEWVSPGCVTSGDACPGIYVNRLHKHINSAVVAAAGDIACDPTSVNFNGGDGTADMCHQKQTADLLTGVDTVLALGDIQYENATTSKFAGSYDPTWGQFKPITYPVPGNHEYNTTGAADYFTYFGAAAVGSWHVIALNSNCSIVSCAAGSDQELWLQADLAANADKQCTLAMWHQAHFTNGPHQPDDDGSTAAFWDDLYASGAELVLNGHDHNYQRFPPLKPDGTPDAGGIREIIVGTGGKDYDRTPTPNPPLPEVAHGGTFGVLKLWLYAGGYDWQFVPEQGATAKFSDYGSTPCH
jgi:acid phosphatase type 7